MKNVLGYRKLFRSSLKYTQTCIFLAFLKDVCMYNFFLMSFLFYLEPRDWHSTKPSSKISIIETQHWILSFPEFNQILYLSFHKSWNIGDYEFRRTVGTVMIWQCILKKKRNMNFLLPFVAVSQRKKQNIYCRKSASFTAERFIQRSEWYQPLVLPLK